MPGTVTKCDSSFNVAVRCQIILPWLDDIFMSHSRSFQGIIFKIRIVDFTGIWTWIIIVEGKQTHHSTTRLDEFALT